MATLGVTRPPSIHDNSQNPFCNNTYQKYIKRHILEKHKKKKKTYATDLFSYANEDLNQHTLCSNMFLYTRPIYQTYIPDFCGNNGEGFELTFKRCRRDFKCLKVSIFKELNNVLKLGERVYCYEPNPAMTKICI